MHGNINGCKFIGGLVGDSDGTSILYCYNEGNVNGDYVIGGIEGRCWDGSVSNCYNRGAVTASNKNDQEMVKAGGVVGAVVASGTVKYCYNIGVVTNECVSTSWAYSTGGICAIVRPKRSGSPNSETQIPNTGSSVLYCYNKADVLSGGVKVGGICGTIDRYCYVRNCHVASYVRGKEETVATAGLGVEPNYVGKMAGNSQEEPGSIYVGDNSLDISSTETVYYVVNGLNSGTSKYWSKSKGENRPTLKNNKII